MTVQLDSSPLAQLIIPVETTDDTAISGSDYTALSSQTVTFAAGQLEATGANLMSQTVTITILEDSLDEANETFNGVLRHIT